MTPEAREAVRLYQQQPYVKAKKQIYFALPTTKERLAQYARRPDVKARIRASTKKRIKTAAYKAWEENNKNQKPVKWLLKAARKRARETGIEFDLTAADVAYPANGRCPVFDVPMIRRTPYAPSLDRMDNSKGYVRGNVTVMSWRANHLKSDGTAEEHKRLTEWMAASG